MPTIEQARRAFARWDGYKEDPPGSNFTVFNDWYYGRRQKAAWCATFFSHSMVEAGHPIPATTSKGFAWTPSGARYFKDRGLWVPWNGPIEVGYAVFFYWRNLGRIGHVGWVDEVHRDGTFHSWEGNTDVAGGRTGGRVLRQHRARGTVGTGGGFGIIRYDPGDKPPPPPAQDRNRPWPGNPSAKYGGYNRTEFERRRDGNVEWIQRRLNGTNLSPKLKADGFFGTATERAVRGFQGAVKIGVDGIVGPRTWDRLRGWG